MTPAVTLTEQPLATHKKNILTTAIPDIYTSELLSRLLHLEREKPLLRCSVLTFLKRKATSELLSYYIFEEKRHF